MATPHPRRCNVCPAYVYDLVHERTRGLAPIDVDPVREGGNIIIDLDRGEYAVAGSGLWRHLNHFVTCESAAAFRGHPGAVRARRARL